MSRPTSHPGLCDSRVSPTRTWDGTELPGAVTLLGLSPG